MFSKWTYPGGKLRELGVEKVSDSELLAIRILASIKEKADHFVFLI
jgi:DNA repair protein RadC